VKEVGRPQYRLDLSCDEGCAARARSHLFEAFGDREGRDSPEGGLKMGCYSGAIRNPIIRMLRISRE